MQFQGYYNFQVMVRNVGFLFQSGLKVKNITRHKEENKVVKLGFINLFNFNFKDLFILPRLPHSKYVVKPLTA